MTKKIKAPAKILWKLRYKKCDYGKLKTPKGTKVCKRKPGKK